MIATDVVERICRQARPSRGCPLPPRAVLRAVTAFLVSKTLSTKGEIVTVSILQLRHMWRVRKFATRCVLYWLGIEDCLYEHKAQKSRLILYRQCVRKKLGLE